MFRFDQVSDERLIQKVFEMFESCWDSIIIIERHILVYFPKSSLTRCAVCGILWNR